MTMTTTIVGVNTTMATTRKTVIMTKTNRNNNRTSDSTNELVDDCQECSSMKKSSLRGRYIRMLCPTASEHSISHHVLASNVSVTSSIYGHSFSCPPPPHPC